MAADTQELWLAQRVSGFPALMAGNPEMDGPVKGRASMCQRHITGDMANWRQDWDQV